MGAIMSFFGRLKGKIDAWFDEQQSLLDQKKESERFRRDISAQIEVDRQKGAEGRLQEAYDQMVSGDITLADYRERILEEQKDYRDNLEALRLDRPSMPREEYEDERDRLEDDKEAIRWRLQWVNDKVSEKTDRPDWLDNSGKWARFVYVDDAGNEGRREIVNWTVRGRYVVGYDRKAKTEKTFRHDRISDWSAG